MTAISTIAAPNNSDLRPYAQGKEDSQVTVAFVIDGIISEDGGVGVVLAKQEHEYNMCRQELCRTCKPRLCIGGANTWPFTCEILRVTPN